MKWQYLYVFIIYLSSTSSKDNCHRGLSDVRRYLGSKTPYRYVAYENSDSVQFDGCHPEKVIGFIRHGTRTSGHKTVSHMKHDLPVLKERIYKAAQTRESKNGLLCSETVEDLFSWEYKAENGDKFLTHEGEDEMIDLAERLQKRFPQLLTHPYSNDTYFFKHTASQRAQESARYFTIGLFGRYKTDSIYFPKGLERDPILRFYKGCDKWKKTIKKNPRAFVQHFEFVVGDEMLKTCEQISSRLGLNYTLTYEDVYSIYTTCAFETSWHKSKLSPWCSVFSESDFEVMLYARDMKHYWLDGYGHELNYKIACPAVKHIFSFLEADDPSNASAVFYFSHSGALLKLMSHLGLYKDQFKLTSSLSKDDRVKRKWNTSYIDAFGTNLIFVSFDCSGEKKILTLHQERPIQIPGCPENGLCPLSLLLNNFRESTEKCHVSDMCSLSK